MPEKNKIRPTVLTEMVFIGMVIEIMIWPIQNRGSVMVERNHCGFILASVSTRYRPYAGLRKTEEGRQRTKIGIFWKVRYEEVENQKSNK